LSVARRVTSALVVMLVLSAALTLLSTVALLVLSPVLVDVWAEVVATVESVPATRATRVRIVPLRLN